MSWTNKYVGIPFKENGRDISGLDCWGLCYLVYKEQYNIDLPRLGVEEFTKDEMLESINTALPYFEEIVDPIAPCIVWMRPTHVGVYTGNGFVLHSDPLSKGLSRLEPLTRLRMRVLGYYTPRV